MSGLQLNTYEAPIEDEEQYEYYTDEYTDTEDHQGAFSRIFPPKGRLTQWSLAVWEKSKRILSMMGSLSWVFTTSMLLIGLPILFAYDREKSLQDQQLAPLPPVEPNTTTQ